MARLDHSALVLLVGVWCGCGGAGVASGPAAPGASRPTGEPAGPGEVPAAQRDYPYAGSDLGPALAYLSDVVLAMLAGEPPPSGPLHVPSSGGASARRTLDPVAAALDFTFRMPTPSNPERLVHLSLFASAAGVKVLAIAESTRGREIPPGLPGWLSGAETDARLHLEVARGGTERSIFLGPDEAGALAGGDGRLRGELQRTFDERFGDTEHIDDVLRGADEPTGVTVESFHLWGRQGGTLHHVTLILTVRDAEVWATGSLDVARVPMDLPI